MDDIAKMEMRVPFPVQVYTPPAAFYSVQDVIEACDHGFISDDVANRAIEHLLHLSGMPAKVGG